MPKEPEPQSTDQFYQPSKRPWQKDTSAWQRLNLYDAPTAPSSLCDLRTQSQVLARLVLEPNLLQESFGDLTVSDFSGSVHQSLFRTLIKLAQEAQSIDIAMIADAWDAEKQVGDPFIFLGQLLDTHGVDLTLASNLRVRVDKLHRLSHLRRLRFVGETLQRHAESPQTDPHELIEKLQRGIEALRDGYDLNGQLLPYAPRNLARRPDLLTLASVEAQSVPWLWQPYLIYGMLNMLSGDPGSGKTFLALAFAAALTVGRIPYTGEPCRPMDVIYLSTENDPQYVLRPRFDALEGDAKRFHALRGALTGDGAKERRESVRLSDIPLLEMAIKQTKARLLVVDPIQSYLGGEVDMHRSNETRPVLDGLAILAERYKVCLLILRHFAKATTGSAINRGLGSIDLTGAVRSELHAGKRDQQSAMVHAKANMGEIGKSIGYEIYGDGQFRWTGESSITANDLASNGMAEEDRDALGEAVESLTEMLRGGPRLASDIMSEMREIGVSQRTLHRAKKQIGVRSQKRAGARHGHFEWVLPGYEDGQIAAS